MKNFSLAQLSLALLFAFANPIASAEDEQVIDRIIAVVNRDIILQSDLDRATQQFANRIRQQGQQSPDTETFQRQVLAFLVDTQVRLQHAEDIGIRVGDDELNTAMRQIATQEGLSLSDLRKKVTAEGLDYRQLREDIRSELITKRLYDLEVTGRINVSQQEIDDYLAHEVKFGNQQPVEYTLQRILIPIRENASADQVEANKQKAQRLVDQLRQGADFSTYAIEHSSGSKALEGGAIGTLSLANMPTAYAEAVVGQSAGFISDPLRTSNGFHILYIAAKSDREKVLVQQSKVRHILLRSNAVRDEDQTREALDKLRRRIRLGDPFADIARAYSEDPRTASAGGELPWIIAGEMPPGFDKMVTSLVPGEISKPFRSPIGWHIVELLERRQQDNTEKHQTTQASNAIRERKAREQEEIWMRRLHDDAYIVYRIAKLAPLDKR